MYINEQNREGNDKVEWMKSYYLSRVSISSGAGLAL